ncbi:protein lin-54 homolog [Spea bombifrons]|uniref:protein lin-54 homolog n=1 Tax=Spea bombifrons TaxID=233779 RepID=UPI00234B67FF|nr:protein lin-54 homolog [Spea bombifrons]XP_053318901.1 protein lin-54 homolog [Spea bombifrons]
MDVVSAEVNNVLPDEIMETEVSMADDDSIEAITVTSPMMQDVPMETDMDEIVEVNSSGECVTSSLAKEGLISTGNHASHLAVVSVSSKPDSGPSTAAIKTVYQSGLHKLGTPVSGQVILNKIPQVSEFPPGSRVMKQEGQKLIVTTLGKPNQPFVLTLPQSQLSNTQKTAAHIQHLDSKGTPQQIKLVTIGGSRTDVKPVLGVSSLTPAQLIGQSAKSTVMQTQQIQTMQIAKKGPASSSGAVITKLIIAKPLTSKPLATGQTTQVSSAFSGKVVSHTNPGTPNKAIKISESVVVGTSLGTTAQTSNKIAISPLKSPPSKVTVVSVAPQPQNSPQKAAVGVPISVALGQQLLTVQQTTPSSPAKAIANSTTAKGVKPGVQTISVGGVSTPQFKTIIPLAAAPNVQQIQVPGSKFHYVRLVTASTANTTTPSSQNPSTSTQPLHQAKPVVVNATNIRMSVPLVSAQTVKQVAPKPLNSTSQIVTTSQPQQRLLMPATPLAQIQPNLTNLPPGTVLAPAPGTGNVGYAVLPGHYVTQLQQSSYVSIASNAGLPGTTSSQNQPRVPMNGMISSESTSRPRKPCNCTKSLCLKLYCDCFANGEFCNNCNCTNCYNNLEHENERQKAIKACLDRNPEAFKPKIGKGKEGESDRRHSKGCNCKRSGCLKNYCECYEAKIMCSSICKCIGCKNFEESPERKTLMHLADAAEVRVQQQTAAKTKLSSQISDLLTRPAPSLGSGGGKLPFTFITKEVAEATCVCLLAQAEQAEKQSKSKAATERMILEEFGRCLMRVINSAGKAKSDHCPMSC